MFNCYTTTGSFSRSSVMDMVGARTQLAGIISGIATRVCYQDKVISWGLLPLPEALPESLRAIRVEHVSLKELRREMRF